MIPSSNDNVNQRRTIDSALASWVLVGLAAYLADFGVYATAWALPDQPGVLSQVHINGFDSPVQGHISSKAVPFKEAVSLEELVKSNKILTFATRADGQEPYVFALEELNHLLQDTILVVIDFVGFESLYSGRLKVKHVVDGSFSPTASKLNGDRSAVELKDIKEKLDLDLAEADLPEDAKSLLQDLARFGIKSSQQEICLEAVLPLSLQENRPI